MDISLKKTHEDPSIILPRDREKHFRQKDHYRLYGRDYLERLKECGFIIRDNNYLDQLDEVTIQRFRLPQEEYMMAFYKEVTRDK
jgi:hypothetical protein